MIVWLASYPRSGNTLLRTVMHQTMGHPTYSDEVDPEVRRTIAHTSEVEKSYGRTELPAPWEKFYAEASASPRLFLVKTHRLPPDNAPAIYVVRDGRPTLASYARFHREFQPQHNKSLLDLVVGDDHYGGWTEHYRAWMGRKGARTMLVRFEDLSDASPELVDRLRDFVGHAGPTRHFENPFARMNAENPRFFGSGRKRWDGDAAWTPFVDAAFFELHGGLMAELGYSTAAEAQAARAKVGEAERALAARAQELARRSRELETVCRERQAVIEGLQQACEERLALIERLSAAASVPAKARSQ